VKSSLSDELATVASERAAQPEAAHRDERHGEKRNEALLSHVAHVEKTSDQHGLDEDVDLRQRSGDNDPNAAAQQRLARQFVDGLGARVHAHARSPWS
jgi:hypothetical protein